MFHEAVEQDAGQDRAINGLKTNTSVIVTRLVIAFPFVGVDYASIFELLRDLPSISHSLE